jgi:hypothetical protein
MGYFLEPLRDDGSSLFGTFPNTSVGYFRQIPPGPSFCREDRLLLRVFQLARNERCDGTAGHYRVPQIRNIFRRYSSSRRLSIRATSLTGRWVKLPNCFAPT